MRKVREWQHRRNILDLIEFESKMCQTFYIPKGGYIFDAVVTQV